MSLPADLSQWIGFTEESILLQDGLLRLGDIVEVPPDALEPFDRETKIQHILSLDGKNAEDLSARIEQLCKSEIRGFRNLLEYRLNALKGLWKAKRETLVWQKNHSKAIEETAVSTVRLRKNATQNDSSSNFSSKLSLLLIFPLIKSQAKVDSSLCQITTQLLLESLRECPPLSLKEPADCLNGIEDLLCSWLGETENGTSFSKSVISDKGCLETTAAALVTLACARNSIKTVLHTVYLLHQIEDIDALPVHDIISILGALEGGSNIPATLNGSKHITCWAYDDQLDAIVSNEQEENNEISKRSITTDGTYLYITNQNGCGLSKIGTGLNGTLRGCVYIKNVTLEAGFTAFANNLLIHRPYTLDNEENEEILATIIDSCTLEMETKIQMIPELLIDCPGSPITLNLTSNGVEYYWIRAVNTNNNNTPITSNTTYLIILDVFKIDPVTKQVDVYVQRKILSKKEDNSERFSGIENILRPKRPQRSSSSNGAIENLTQSNTTTTSVASSPVSNNNNNAKDVNSTSVGIQFKTLKLCPIITCGNFITIITPTNSSSTPANQLARSLFSGGQNSTKTFAVSNTFSVKDGQFCSKSDLIDVCTSGFSKGGAVTNMCATFDTFNNVIWTASTDYIDQYHNTGHPSATFTLSRLGIDTNSKKLETRENNLATVQEIISTLTEHTGLMCLHYMSNELFNSACNILSDRSTNLNHFDKVLNLLQKAINENDKKTTLCLLVFIQYHLQTFSFDKLTEIQKEIFSKLKKILWSIIESNSNSKELKGTVKEACNALISSMNFLYTTDESKIELLKHLFTISEKNTGMRHLRGQVLKTFSSVFSSSKVNLQLQSQQLQNSYDLNMTILKKTLEEADEMINNMFDLEKEDFTRFNCSIPTLSPSLEYLSAFTKFFLSNLLLRDKEREEEEEDEGKQTFFDFVEDLFDGCQKVFENIQEKVTSIKSKFSKEESEQRLFSLENILKSTVISNVFIPIVTAMSDNYFFDLERSQELIMKLVQMSDLTCQISQMIHLESSAIPEELKDSCLFSKLKIPTPWAAGRNVESSHPLRDNYKFKETIKIPGARCLFVKFDKRCSSQYDYDKLVLHAGNNE